MGSRVGDRQLQYMQGKSIIHSASDRQPEDRLCRIAALSTGQTPLVKTLTSQVLPVVLTEVTQ